jgi:hypothetical protein
MNLLGRAQNFDDVVKILHNMWITQTDYGEMFLLTT